MLSLLLSTLAMMGLTFIIGFFVAGVIKIIANWADLFDFYALYRKDVLSFKKSHALQEGLVVADIPSMQKGKSHNDRYKKMFHKINDTISGLKPRTRIPA